MCVCVVLESLSNLSFFAMSQDKSLLPSFLFFLAVIPTHLIMNVTKAMVNYMLGAELGPGHENEKLAFFKSMPKS